MKQMNSDIFNMGQAIGKQVSNMGIIELLDGLSDTDSSTVMFWIRENTKIYENEIIWK